MTIKPGMKIIATNTDYPEGVPNGSIMTVVYVYNNGDVHAYVDNGDGVYWYMFAGTYEPYIVKSDDATPADDTPVLWRDMTPAQKGTLLLAYHEGKSIECWQAIGYWLGLETPGWGNTHAYRVKPEPVVEVERVTIINADGVVIGLGTVTTNNGKPDVDSIKMEEL